MGDLNRLRNRTSNERYASVKLSPQPRSQAEVFPSALSPAFYVQRIACLVLLYLKPQELVNRLQRFVVRRGNVNCGASFRFFKTILDLTP